MNINADNWTRFFALSAVVCVLSSTSVIITGLFVEWFDIFPVSTSIFYEFGLVGAIFLGIFLLSSRGIIAKYFGDRVSSQEAREVLGRRFAPIMYLWLTVVGFGSLGLVGLFSALLNLEGNWWPLATAMIIAMASAYFHLGLAQFTQKFS